MEYKAYNRSSRDVSDLEQMMTSFMPFAQKRIGFNRPPTINWASDDVNAKNALGKTGFYDPAEMSITVFVDNRHPKDILRSLSHELVHHGQNCRGDLNSTSAAGEQGYAQKDPHLREMEREAYEVGNLCFRDWEDNYKQQTNYKQVDVSLNENKQLRSKIMGINDKRYNTLNKDLMERWGYKITEEEEEIEEGFGAERRGPDPGDALSTEQLMALMNSPLDFSREQLRGLNKSNLTPEMIKVLQADGLVEEGSLQEFGAASSRQGPDDRRPDERKRPLEEVEEGDDDDGENPVTESALRKIVRETIRRKLKKNG